ncbi:energy transducer TonB [Sphingomonas morindae]|uniref:Energy transducer TonB n=1 Tax=Sphingomonas morindae TaxID=1541170 RepID=A0ABY4X706_9SPHN|nr:energy transducer TonB [Sphingomonas morindae]USI72634.1 energy transducer TonB [Sphingomonas morindae]
MAYVDQNQSKEKTIAFVVTLVIMAAVGYALVTGLAYNVIKKAAKDLNVIDIQDQPPPPPEEPPPPPPETPKVETPPPPVSPPPLVQPPAAPPPIATQTTLNPPPPAPPIVAPPAPPSPPAPPARPSQAVGAKPKGSPSGWVTTDDYPPAALRNEEQGRVGFKLDIDGTGRATNCTVTSSSGHPDLDDTACKLLVRRARFSPAKDAAGNGIPSAYSSTVVWQIPKE